MSRKFDSVRMIVTLTVICALSGSVLALVHRLTLEPIRLTELNVKLSAIRNVLPLNEEGTALLPDPVEIKVEDKAWSFYVAQRHGMYAGVAFETTSPLGYAGNITLMVGLNAQDEIHAVEVLQHKETPGLGAKISEAEFLSPLRGLPAATTVWRVKKDGGPIDQITAATISSRAVADAVQSGVKAFMTCREQVTAAAKQGAGHAMD